MMLMDRADDCCDESAGVVGGCDDTMMVRALVEVMRMVR